MKFIVKTAPQTQKNIKLMKVNAKLPKAQIENALEQIGQDVTRYIRTGIERQPKTGIHYTKVAGTDGQLRLYPRKGKYAKGRLHKASARGQFPAILNADYIRSIDYSRQGHTRVEFGSDDTKAEWLEFGTKNMAARKPVTRAFKERQKNAFNYLRWESVLKKIK